jgi:catechol 2,3-dioxygenase-like lactoylglutathione lyase family enzyme
MTIRIEHSDSQLVEEITLTKPDGTEDRLVFQCVINGQKTTNLLNGMEVSGCSRWEGDELIIESWIKSGQRERYFCDCWSLSADGRNLTMEHRNDDLAGQIVVLERTAEPRLDFFSAIDHVQLAMPEGQEGKAREFFIGVLGMRELTKPANLAARGGCWFESGGVQIHLGVERDFRPALKAHPALRCRNYDDLLRRLAGHGVARQDDDNIPGARRCHIADPFGNRIELIAE